MKAKIIGIEGEEVGEISLPRCFEEEIRRDLIHKVFWAIKKRQQQPYGAYILAGKEVSASGKQRHARRKWKTLYGKGMSRIPRKTLSHRGEQFYWIGAFIPGTVGGREAHPPKPLRSKIKINKKENRKAINSAIAASASIDLLKKKYPKIKLNVNPPIIIDSKILEESPKKIKNLIEKILSVELKKAKILLVLGKEENANKIRNYGIDLTNITRLNILELAPGGTPGRIIIWTNKAIEELNKNEKNENKINKIREGKLRK